MDQAKALRSCGLSNRGLGPLMPVCVPAAKQTTSGTRSEQQTGGGAGAMAGAAAAPADSKPAAAAGSDPAAETEVVWVHRQCALWSPEVYPDPSGVLVSGCSCCLGPRCSLMVMCHAATIEGALLCLPVPLVQLGQFSYELHMARPW
jgi:hypothetical protein